MRLHIRPRIRRAFRLALRRRDLTEGEIDEELRFHVELRVAQLVARGLTSEEAEAEARRRFGAPWAEAVERLHEAGNAREERLAMRERVDGWWHDTRYATRTLMRQRGFTAVVLATFALGIGANATMFGLLDHLLLEPPAGIRAPESLALATYVTPTPGSANTVLHYPFATALRADSATFSDVAAVAGASAFTLGRGPTAEPILVSLAGGTYFTTLRTHPALGRLFGPDDDRDGSPGVVVVSHAFWTRRFGADRTVIGKTVQIGPREFTLVGVAERGFNGVQTDRVDAWIPIAHAGALRQMRPGWKTDWGSFWISVVTRLRPGVRADVASARATAAYIDGRVAAGEETRNEAAESHEHIELRSVLPSRQLEDVPEAKVAKLLVAVTIAVLLIGCANVANLLVARGTERRREIAIRLALGVPRSRLVRLLFLETAALALLGGIVALGVAAGGVRLLSRTLFADVAWTDSLIEPRLVAATLGLVVVTGLLAGLAPALSASRPNVTETLKSGGREGGVRRTRVVATLITVQAALSVLLLVGAGLFVTSLRRVSALQLGYDPERVIAARMNLAGLGYKGPERLAVFQTMRDRVADLPGVSSVATSSVHPLDGWALAAWGVHVPGRDSLPQPKSGGPYGNAVSGDYFKTLGLRIVEGRPISDADVRTDARVTVLSEPMARAYWPSQPAVGRCIYIGDSTCTTVVGVVADARESVRRRIDRFLIYMPATRRWTLPANVLLIRSADDRPERLVATIRRTMQSSAPNLPYADVQPLDGLLARQTRPWRIGARLFALFGVLAVTIAALGLYSAISYAVAQRRHELGVRMSLGAREEDIVMLVIGQGIQATVAGLVVGLLAAVVAGRFVATLLFDTSPVDPLVFFVVGVLMLVVALAATAFPAWRASRVDPVTALRAE